MANVSVIQRDAIVEELEQLHQRIARRAYDLFCGRDGWGDAVGDWLSAEAELVSRPAVELRGRHGGFTVAVALPGVDAKDISVNITPQDVVIKAVTKHAQPEDKDDVHRRECSSDEFFGSLHFSKLVDAARARADYQNGMLKISVPIARETKAQRGRVKAA